jgi:hypothetical protein
MSRKMKLKFPISQIKELSKRYENQLPPKKWELESRIIEHISPAYRKRGYLTKIEFLQICDWKSQRPRSHQKANDEEFIKEISRLSLSTKNEQLQIQVWTLLNGVNWRTASVFLHFAFPNKYPILDIYALNSLGKKKKRVLSLCNFVFWQKYTKFCRSIARRAKVVDMRTLDRALWLHSKRKRRR